MFASNTYRGQKKIIQWIWLGLDRCEQSLVFLSSHSRSVEGRLTPSSFLSSVCIILLRVLCGTRDDRSLVFHPPYRHIAYYTRSISINSPVIYLKTVGLVSFRNMKTYPLGTLDVSLSVLIVKRFFLSLCLCRPTSTSVLVRPTRRSRRFKRHWALAQRLQSKRKLLCTKYPQFR